MILGGSTRVSYKNMRQLKQLTRKVIEQKSLTPTKQCIDKYTEFGFIDDVNIIEVKEKSPDEMRVRLELIKETRKSKKVSISVEKIQKEWKIAYMNLNTYF